MPDTFTFESSRLHRRHAHPLPSEMAQKWESLSKEQQLDIMFESLASDYEEFIRDAEQNLDLADTFEDDDLKTHRMFLGDLLSRCEFLRLHKPSAKVEKQLLAIIDAVMSRLINWHGNFEFSPEMEETAKAIESGKSEEFSFPN